MKSRCAFWIFADEAKSANYMPESCKTADRFILKYYEDLRDSEPQARPSERQIIGYSSKNFFCGEKHAGPKGRFCRQAFKAAGLGCHYSNAEDYPGRHIKLKIDEPALDFAAAKDMAGQKRFAMTRCCCPGTGAKPVNPTRA